MHSAMEERNDTERMECTCFNGNIINNAETLFNMNTYKYDN